ncbi:hypothetical protein, conserved [Plasmodium gonderi]|uniref:Uncharacterized protein n=1 Tax=Plasmodium gonderi TaxID=77519 RepID=A0A1Y1JK75_PLAGO|nr:hypothetical protein, conserved [Plasmodium gonderi]GAW82899.1 hypothetical protein, conserved [Plasmodium gonderi]
MIFYLFIFIILSWLSKKCRFHFCNFNKDKSKYLLSPLIDFNKNERNYGFLRKRGNLDSLFSWNTKKNISRWLLRNSKILSITKQNHQVRNHIRLNSVYFVRNYSLFRTIICTRNINKRWRNKTIYGEGVKYNAEKDNISHHRKNENYIIYKEKSYFLRKKKFRISMLRKCDMVFRNDNGINTILSEIKDSLYYEQTKGNRLYANRERENIQKQLEKSPLKVSRSDCICLVSKPFRSSENSPHSNISEEYTKLVIDNILKDSWIHNCTKNDYLRKILKEIQLLLCKLKAYDYEYEHQGNKMLDVHLVTTDEKTVKRGEHKMEDKYETRRSDIFVCNSLNKSDDFSRRDKLPTFDKHISVCSSFPECIFKTWISPLNSMFIKLWIGKIVKSIFVDNYAEEEFAKNNNIFVKIENNNQKKLFFYLVCFYSFLTNSNGANCNWLSDNKNITEELKKEIIIYLYKHNEEEAEKFYNCLKNVYNKECISFFSYNKYIHNDKFSSIIFLSYEEFFNLTVHIVNKTPNDLETYLNNKVNWKSGYLNLYSFFSNLLVNSPSCNIDNGKAKGNKMQYTFKIFLNDFNIKYNYEKGVIEKNLYEHIFSAINMNNEEKRKNITFYFFSRTNFHTQWFKIWLEQIHKSCYFVNLQKKKKMFILHKKFIFPLKEKIDHHFTMQYSDINLERWGRQKKKKTIQENKGISPSLYPFFEYIKNKKRNFINQEVENYMSIFNKYRKGIIVEYLKRNNLYNTNKLKKKDKKIKRKFNIARRFLKKKKKNLHNLDTSHYINFLINKKKKGNILFKKKVIDHDYVVKKECLQICDKVQILTNNVSVLYRKCGHEQLSEKLQEERFLPLYSNGTSLWGKTRLDFSWPRHEQFNGQKEYGRKNQLGKYKKEYSDINDAQLYLQNEGQAISYYDKHMGVKNEVKYFYSKKEEGENGKLIKFNSIPVYPCIYYIFDKDIFEKFSKELYTSLTFLPEQLMQKWRNVLKRFYQVVYPNVDFKKYMLKGLFLVKQKLNQFEKDFVEELLKNKLIKIILSCVNISSYGFNVKTVFVEDVQVHVKDNIPNYNQLIDMINSVHKKIFRTLDGIDMVKKKSPFEKTDLLDEEKRDNVDDLKDDMYRLHFVKYFMFLNFSKIFRKYTMSNNDLLNLFTNCTNCFLIPKRYEDISIFLNLQSDNYINMSHLCNPLHNDFYFNLHNLSIDKGVSFYLNGSGEMMNIVAAARNLQTKFADFARSEKSQHDNIKKFHPKKKTYRFFSTQGNGDEQEENLFVHRNICFYTMKTALDVHKIYKYKETNESIFLNSYLNVMNEITYSVSYFEFLYFYFTMNKNMELLESHLENSIFEFYSLKRKEYEKEFVKYNREFKMNAYQEKAEKIKKYFDENYAYMYYDTYVKYNRIKRDIRQKLKIMYKHKYNMLYQNIKEWNQNSLVLTSVDSEQCVILDVYKNEGLRPKKKKHTNEQEEEDLYICVNSRNELFICNIFFFDRVIMDKKLNHFIRQQNKHLSYVDYLFTKREVIDYKLFIEEHDFVFDICCADCTGGADCTSSAKCTDDTCGTAWGEKNCTHSSETKKKKKKFSHFIVNKIKMNKKLPNLQNAGDNRTEEISLEQETTKMINLDDMFLHSYNENLYACKRSLALYWKKLRSMKREMLEQCAKSVGNMTEKVTANKQKNTLPCRSCSLSMSDSFVETHLFNTRTNGYLEQEKRFHMHSANKLTKGEGNNSILSNRSNGWNKAGSKKIMSAKIMKMLNIYKKRKNSGNRNSYTNELNKLDRIFGNKRKTIIEEFKNIFYFLHHLNLIDILRRYSNPYIQNTMWLYIITLYINQQYEMNTEKFYAQPELLIIIFYICFCKKEHDYVENYLSSFQIQNDQLLDIVVDIFAYKQLLSFVQKRFKINMDITLNLEGIQKIYIGLIKLKEKKFMEVGKEVEDKLHELSMILHASISTNFNKSINGIILSFIGYLNELKRNKKMT